MFNDSLGFDSDICHSQNYYTWPLNMLVWKKLDSSTEMYKIEQPYTSYFIIGTTFCPCTLTSNRARTNWSFRHRCASFPPCLLIGWVSPPSPASVCGRGSLQSTLRTPSVPRPAYYQECVSLLICLLCRSVLRLNHKKSFYILNLVENYNLQSSSRSKELTPPPNNPLKNPILGGSGISQVRNRSPNISVSSELC